LRRPYKGFTDAVGWYLDYELSLFPAKQLWARKARALSNLRDVLGGLGVPPDDEDTKNAFAEGHRVKIALLLYSARDFFEKDLLDSRASGFSHGFWVFR